MGTLSGTGTPRDDFLQELQRREVSERGILERLGIPADLNLGYPSKPAAVTAALNRIRDQRDGQRVILALLTLRNIAQARDFLAAGDSYAAAEAMLNVGIFADSRFVATQEADKTRGARRRGAEAKAAHQREQWAEWQAIVDTMPKHTTKTQAAMKVTHVLAARRQQDPSIVLPSVNTVRGRISLTKKLLSR